MKKIVTLFLTVIMVISIAIVVYAKSLTTTASNGVYKLQSTITTNYKLGKDEGKGTTRNTTSDITCIDSRPCVYVAALDKEGYVIQSYFAKNSKMEISKRLEVKCEQFWVRSYLMEASRDVFRVIGPSLYQ